jgi:hypothetical protein
MIGWLRCAVQAAVRIAEATAPADGILGAIKKEPVHVHVDISAKLAGCTLQALPHACWPPGNA